MLRFAENSHEHGLSGHCCIFKFLEHICGWVNNSVSIHFNVNKNVNIYESVDEKMYFLLVKDSYVQIKNIM